MMGYLLGLRPRIRSIPADSNYRTSLVSILRGCWTAPDSKEDYNLQSTAMVRPRYHAVSFEIQRKAVRNVVISLRGIRA